MKLKWVTCVLLVLVGVAIRLPAQQNDADRKLLAEIRARAEKGDAQSQLELGAAFDFGKLGVAKDQVEAVKWYRKAADQNFAMAQFDLGTCYYNGRGVVKDKAEAVKWYRKAAEQNLAIDQYNLGHCYDNGDGVPKDEVEAVKWYRKAAEQNLAPAQYNLGVCYYIGDSVAKDVVEAVKWYRKAAEQNFAGAQFNLGVCYAKGDGVTKDAVEAVKWYRKAAEQNVAEAQYNLGFCYAKGQGVAKDAVEAVKWFRKAAEQNQDRAQLMLGICYANGDGVTKDSVEEVKWYRKAAEQNNAEAQLLLGLSYANGDGVKKDAVEAVKWYRKAAEQNLAEAQYLFGGCYYNGLGILIDYVEAYKWNALAAAQGNEDAVNRWRYVFQEKLTPEQISEGQRRAAAFKPSNAAQASPSVLGNRVDDSQPTASGTGFFITPDGYLISNAHVVEGATKVRLVTSEGLISAKVVKIDSANDIALLKAEGKFSPLPIISSRSARLGGTVATVGFPNIGLQGFAPKLAKGEIASLSGASDDARYFQISVPVQPGNSGGALVDERGNVMGIVSAKLNASAALAASGALPENVNYAVKSSFLLSFLESVPEVSAKLKEPNTGERKFEDVVKSAEQAAVLVLVY